MAYIIKDELGEYVNLAQITELTSLLVGTNIPFELTYLWKTPHIEYPQRGNCKCSVICNDVSYGGKQGLLEIMGLLTKEEEEHDSVIGYLHAENVLERTKKDYAGGK